jgi:amino acid transporter
MSYFACALGSLNAAARVLFSMAKQQLFFKSFGTAHRTNFTPAKSITAVSLIGLVSPALLLAFNYTLTDCINYLTQLASFGCIAAYFAVCLRHHSTSSPRNYCGLLSWRLQLSRCQSWASSSSSA